MSEGFEIRCVGADEVDALVEPLADVLLDCVEGGASVSFMWPLPRARALAFWRDVADGVRRGERLLLIGQTRQGRVDGTVQLLLAQPDNQPHRADLAKMLVHRRARRRGLARALLAAAEQGARDAGKRVLVLDTATGGDAERLYERAGWQRVGVIPDYALMPDGRLCATTYFHKPV